MFRLPRTPKDVAEIVLGLLHRSVFLLLSVNSKSLPLINTLGQFLIPDFIRLTVGTRNFSR